MNIENNFKIFDNDQITDFIDSGITTPCYVYDRNILHDTTFLAAKRAVEKYFDNSFIHYAIKANHNATIVNYEKHGMGIDCVSGGEVQRALDEGVEPSHIVFAGVGKADWEIELALGC